LELDTLVMIQTQFGFHWSSTFRGEDFWKSLRRTTDDDDGRQVMAIAHMTLWVRWAQNWQTRAWDPIFKTAGSAPDAAMILGLFSQKILRLTLIVSYIELFIFIFIFFGIIRMI
jgi:hypothetical protein